MAKRKTTKSQKFVSIYEPYGKRLKDFPLFMRGCEQIAADSGCGMGPNAHELDPESEVAAYSPGIAFVESVLKRLDGKTLKEFIPEMLELEFYDDLEPDSQVLDSVFLGVNDSSEMILAKLGLQPHEIWLVENCLNEFFQGELHHVFMKPKAKRGSVKGGGKRAYH